MKKPFAILSVLLLALSAAPFPRQEVIEEIVAVINDEIITLSQAREQYELFLREIRAQNLSPEEYDKQRQTLKDELLNLMIQNILVLQKAKELDINVGEQLRTIIENIKKENNLASDDELKRALQQQGVTYDSWYKQYEQELLRQAVIYSEVERSIVLDDADVVQYYRQHPEEFRIPQEYKLRAVYLAQEGKNPTELEALRRTIAENAASGEDFAALAGRYSDPPFNENKGDPRGSGQDPGAWPDQPLGRGQERLVSPEARGEKGELYPAVRRDQGFRPAEAVRGDPAEEARGIHQKPPGRELRQDSDSQSLRLLSGPQVTKTAAARTVVHNPWEPEAVWEMLRVSRSRPFEVR
jgi:parvulin-like peptidyl-prolyl isomerase